MNQETKEHMKEFNLSKKIEKRKLELQKMINKIEKLGCSKCNIYGLCGFHKTHIRELLNEQYHIDKITKHIKEFIKRDNKNLLLLDLGEIIVDEYAKRKAELAGDKFK